MTDQEYLDLKDKHPFYADPYDGQKEDQEAIINYNKRLCSRYPFLTPRNVFSGLVDDDYDYSYSALDAMPDGWRRAFGIEMMEDIRKALLKAQELNPGGGYKECDYTTNYDSTKTVPYLEGYHPIQIKSKWGSLRWYDNGAPDGLEDIIQRYEDLSEKTCEICGAPAKYISTEWIAPYCEKCAKEEARDEDFDSCFCKIGETFLDK